MIAYDLRFHPEHARLARFGFLLLDAPHVGPARSLAQAAGHLRKFVHGSNGVHFYSSIVQISGVPGEAQVFRGALREIAEADSLHPAANEPAACGLTTG